MNFQTQFFVGPTPEGFAISRKCQAIQIHIDSIDPGADVHTIEREDSPDKKRRKQ
jgi:hypothetical protein